MSKPEYEGRVKITFLRVPMRDGVELGVKITRPDADGQFPAVMAYNPYRTIRKPSHDYRDESPPVVPYLAERGYVIAQYDVRGTGNSGGWSTDIYSQEEQRDAYEMVEWLAIQPWCNGNVGMIGKSYGAVVQWQVAVQAPPHLKAIIVRSGNEDVYTDWVYPGGCLRPYMFDSYSSLMTAYNFAPPDPDIVGEKWSEIWQERLENNRPWGIGYISHPLQGAYWQDRSLKDKYDRVKCAVYVMGGWSDCYPTPLLSAFSKLNTPKRVLIGPWGHWYGEEKVAVPGPRIDSRLEHLRWFDYWLKGIDNNIMDEPPVTIFVKQYEPPAVRMPIEEPGSWRLENEWPIARTEQRSMFLHPEGVLSPQPYADREERDEYAYDPAVGITSGIHWGGGILPWGMPIDQRLDEALSLTYTTSVLEEDLEVTGNPTAILYISSTADVAYFRVKLIDVAPDGTSKLVRYGGLNATHRNSHSQPELLQPGKVYELQVPLKAMSYVFEAGHRIRVAIASADIQNAWPTSKNALNAVHRGQRYPSRVILPVVPVQHPELPEPDLKRLPNADSKILHKPSEYTITRDLANQTTTVRLGKKTGGPNEKLMLQSSFTTSSLNPANASLKADATYTVVYPGMEISVEANEVTVSDTMAFHHLTTVEISVNGKHYFDNSWSVTTPRQLN